MTSHQCNENFLCRLLFISPLDHQKFSKLIGNGHQDLPSVCLGPFGIMSVFMTKV